MSSLIQARWYIYAWVNYGIISSDNGSLPLQHPAIICTNVGLLLIAPLGIKFRIQFELKYKMFHARKLNMIISSAKWQPSWLHLIVIEACAKCNSNNLVGWNWQTSVRRGIAHCSYCTFQHWNGNVILTKCSSLAALEVAKMTTSEAESDENFIKMVLFFSAALHAQFVFYYCILLRFSTIWFHSYFFRVS